MTEPEGPGPDYRFTLANERTFLAWIRTSLGLLAGGVGLIAVVPDLGIDWLQRTAAAGLVLLSLVISVLAYRRWQLADQAIRSGQALPQTRLLQMMSGVLTVVAVAALILVLL